MAMRTGGSYWSSNIELYHCPITRGLITAIEEKNQAPNLLIIGATVSMYTTFLHGIVNVETFEGQESGVNSFTHIIADSGVGKSTVYSLLASPVQNFEQKLKKYFEQELVEYQAAKEIMEIKVKEIKQRIRKATRERNEEELVLCQSELVDLKKELREPTCKKIIADDSTPEALSQNLSRGNGVLSLHSPEGASITDGRLMDNLALLCKVWSGESITIDRKTHDRLSVDNPRVSMLIMSQLSVLNKLVKKKGETLSDIGFFARCLFFFIENNQGERRHASFNVCEDTRYKTYLERADELLEVLESYMSEPEKEKVLVKYTPEARRYFDGIKQNIEANLAPGGRYEYARGHGAKLGEQISRIAAVLTQFELGIGADITLGVLQDAERIVSYSSHQYLQYFEIYPDYIKVANALSDHLNTLRQDGQRYARKSTLRRSSLRIFRDSDLFDMALDYLVEKNEIRVYWLQSGLVYLDLYPFHQFDQVMWNKFCYENNIS